MSSAIVPNMAKQYSGFTPLSITGCTLWLDAADTSSLTFSGSNVTQWNDRSGNGRNATNVGTITTTTINGLTALDFSTNRMTIASYPFSTYSTIFLVVKSTNGNFLFSQSNGTSYRNFYYTGNWPLISLSINNGATSMSLNDSVIPTGTVVPTNAYFVFGLGYNGGATTYVYHVNGTARTSTSGPGISNGTSTFPVYINGNSSGSFDTSVVCEIIHYTTAFATAQRQQIEGYLAWKWGIVSSLPTSHPFKLTPLYTQPFSPLDIDNCQLWLDAADASTVSVSGSYVTQWKDKSGSANHASIVGNNATYASNTVTLNGSGQFTSNYSSALATETFFIVYRWSTISASAAFIQGSQTNQRVFYTEPATSRWPYFGGVGVWGRYSTTALSANVTYLTGFTWNSSGFAVSIFLNGNTLTLTNVGTAAGFSGTPITSYIGASLNGNIYEIIGYNAVLTTLQRQQVEGYLAKKWGIMSSLGSTHPFKLYPMLTLAFTPVQISNCTLWLDAADATTVTISSGSTVSQWNDKSGNGKNAVAYGTVTYSLGQQNKNNVIVLNGTTSYLLSPLTLNSALHTLIAVHKPTTSNLDIFRVQDGGGYIAYPYWIDVQAGYGYVTGYDSTPINYQNSTLLDGAAANAYNLSIATIQTGSQVTYLNGAQVANTTQTLSSVTTSALSIGAYTYTGGPALFYGGNLCELIIYNAFLTTYQRQQIEGYLANKWRIPLPSAHPYTKVAVPFNPSQLAGLSLWLDASDSSTITLNGTIVTNWADKSPKALTSTPSGSPTIVNSALNGLPAVSFNGSSQYFNFGNVNNLAYSHTHIFAIAKFNSTADGTIIAKSLYGPGAGRYSLVRSGGLLIPLIQGSLETTVNNGGTADTNTTARLLGMSWNRATDYLYINGTQSFSATVADTGNLTNTYSVLVGAYNNSSGTTPPAAGLYFNGYIMELLQYFGPLSTLQRQQIEGYLAWKWGLQASLPAGHPYINTKP